jgi:uncharacterized iron-regulated membrane protein
MTLRQLVLVTHRWLGLSTGLILAIAGATGTVLVFATGRLRGLTGPVHEALAAGRIGAWVVLAATALAVLLEAGGVYLWWRRKVLTIETRFGWRRMLNDLHHVSGLAGLVLMTVLAVTAVMMRFVTPASNPWLREVIVDLHTTRDYGWALKTLFGAASLGFVVQGVTGVVMWWKPGRR